MHIELVTRRFDLPEVTRGDLEARIEELGALGQGIDEATVSLEQNHHRYAADITLFGNRISFHAETGVEADSVSKAIDMILTKAEKQLRRHKERLRDARRQSRWHEPMQAETSALAEFPVEAASTVTEPAEDDPAPPDVVPEPERFEDKPMTVQEASAQLDRTRSALLVFRNAETREVNVVLRRDDGRIGWVQP